MSRLGQQIYSLLVRSTPYPLAVQSVVLLTLLATPLSWLSGASKPVASVTLAVIIGLHLLAVLLVPARRLPRWAQLLYLLAQCALTATAQALAPATLLSYVYLTIVLQAITLFPLWLWIPFAVGVWMLWSGVILFASSNLIAWLQSNLALAFPATCAIIAAIVYMRQQRRSEQVQQMLNQVQQHYDSLASGMRELQQRAMLEERHRLSQTIVGEVQGTLARTEQSVAAALNQAQNNLARLQHTVAQTRAAASSAVERLRATVATLRFGEPAAPPPAAALAGILVGNADELVITSLTNRVLTWVLPSLFVSGALALTLVQQRPAPHALGLLLACCCLLLVAYVCTQRVRNPVLLQAGLAGQTVAVLSMTLLTQTLPLLLGLLLVLWQLSLRLPLRQIVLYLAGVPTTLGLLVARLWPDSIDYENLLIGTVAAVAVGGPLLLARRQLDRRKQAEMRLALLSAEIEQQTDEVRALAVAAERSRMAREVHDDLGSRLVLINLQLQLAEDLAGDDSEAALCELHRSREQLHAAWRSVLAVADAELPLHGVGLRAALEELAHSGGTASPATILRLEGPLDDLEPPVANSVYRAVQEGLTNARKHAKASQVALYVLAESGYVTVSVTDNGPLTAVPVAREEVASGFGLIGLRERAEALGGGLEAGPLPEGGWRLRLVLPAEAEG